MYGRRIANLISRSRADRSIVRVPLVVGGCALVLAVAACGGSSDARGGMPRRWRPSYTLMQMNLCLSGFDACYVKVAYPAVLREAVARIREARPQAVTFNEACGGDVALIARRTGYHLSFSKVIYRGMPLRCIKPGGRGLFGDAVLTKSAIESSSSRPFEAQAGVEQRRWLCVTTRVGIEVCTAHLASSEPDEVAANEPQCSELQALLAELAASHTVIFGGDVNRLSSCAPNGFWIRTDASAGQNPGLQQVYGTGALGSPSAEVIPARHTDHDILVVRSYLTSAR